MDACRRWIWALVAAALVAAGLLAAPGASAADGTTVTISGDRLKIVDAGTVVLTGTAVGTATSVEVLLDGAAVATADVGVAGDWQATLDLNGSSGGRHSLIVRAAEDSGSARGTLVVRPAGNAVEITSPGMGASLSTSANGRLEITGHVDLPPGGSGATTVETAWASSLAGGTGGYVTVDRATGELRASVPTSAIPNGPQVLGLVLPCGWDAPGSTACGLVTVDLTTTGKVKAHYDNRSDEVSASIALVDWAPDSVVTLEIAGRELPVLSNLGAASARIQLHDVEGTSWIPAAATYPVVAHITSRGRTTTTELDGGLALDPTSAFQVISAPSTVMDRTYVSVRVKARSIKSFVVKGPAWQTYFDGTDPENSTLGLHVDDAVGTGKVVITATGYDLQQHTVSFPLIVTPYDDEGPRSDWTSGTRSDDLGEFGRARERLVWSVSDLSPIARVELRSLSVRMGTARTGSWSAPQRLPVNTRSVTMPLTPGRTTCWQVRATDTLGYVGPWSYASCGTRAMDDRGLTLGRGAHHARVHKAFRHTLTDLGPGRSRVKLPGIAAGNVVVQLRGTACSWCSTTKVRIGNSPWQFIDLRRTGKIGLSSQVAFAASAGGRLMIKNRGGIVRIDSILVTRSWQPHLDR